jgi:chromosome segregation ATPase
MARFIPLWMGCVWIAAAGVATAQDSSPNSLTTLQQDAAKRSSEWSTLATNLEQRLARLLPCDPRIRTSIDEASRASNARITALTAYWTAVSEKSRQQIEAIQKLLAQGQSQAPEWSTYREEAEQHRAAVDAQNAVLAANAKQVPALAGAQKMLDAIAQSTQQMMSRAQDQQTTAAQLTDELRNLLKASQDRQTAIDQQLKSINTEGTRWSAYYVAREARAQTECAITNPAAAPARPAGGGQGKKK